MGIFTGENEDVVISLDSGALAFLRPRAQAAGVSVAQVIAQLVTREILAIENEQGAQRPTMPHSERGVLSALFLLGSLPEFYREPSKAAWCSRPRLAATTGLSLITTGQAVRGLQERGFLRTKQAGPEKGRCGPPPLLYSLSPEGARAAFEADPNSEVSMVCAGAWDDHFSVK